jgi:hypothetical protein
MEKQSLGDFLKKMWNSPELGAHKEDIHPWYNSDGDCIEFRTKHEAFVADRVDEYLTVYRSIDAKEPIGFQLKDVRVLVKQYGALSLNLKAEVSGTTLISVSVSMLLLAAYESSPVSIARRQGYASVSAAYASTQTQKIIDQVTIGQ